MAEHPPHVTLVPGATTGVEEWDKVGGVSGWVCGWVAG